MWLSTIVGCVGITAYYATAILDSNRATQLGIERIIIQGARRPPVTETNRVMHQVFLTRRDGVQVQIDVDGTATPAQVTEFMASFFAGDEEPPTWKVTEWTIAGGGTIKVTTPPLPGEVPGGASHCARHDQFVADLQDRFPPV